MEVFPAFVVSGLWDSLTSMVTSWTLRRFVLGGPGLLFRLVWEASSLGQGTQLHSERLTERKRGSSCSLGHSWSAGSAALCAALHQLLALGTAIFLALHLLVKALTCSACSCGCSVTAAVVTCTAKVCFE